MRPALGWGAAAAALLAFGIVGAMATGTVAPQRPPAATPTSLSANPTYADMGGSWNCGQGHQTFQFFSNVAGGAGPYSYNWTFGDGTPISANATPTHTYQRTGAFVVNVTVRDGAGESVTASVTPIWGISLTCTSSGPNLGLEAASMAVYLTLIGGIVVGVAVVFRLRRRQSPP